MNHPDQDFAQYILRGIEQGFRVGFDPMRADLQSARRSLLSAMERPDVIEKYLAKEMSAGRVVQVAPGLAEAVYCSPFGVVPKKSKPDAWRLIVDLSSPEGHSVNDGIGKELATLTYVSIDEVMEQVLQSGRGALLAKMDIKQAYRNVPVHPDDRTLLGMSWKKEVFMDTTLPFGLRSAPLIFSALADALQ